MRRILVSPPIGILLICFVSILRSEAQQNLFNVPSSDITLQGKPFFQQQFNISKGLIQFNSTFSYGLGAHTEVGLNVLGLNVEKDFSLLTNGNKSVPPVYPFFMFNFQKAVVLNRLLKFGVGTQAGFSKGGHFGSYTYANLVTALTHTRSKIITGAYYGSNSFLGTEERNPIVPVFEPVGFQLGIEQQIIEEKLLFIAENITGKHGLGETTLGGAYYLTEHWVLSAGYQFANPNSKTLSALVIEVTYVPSSTTHQKIYKHGHKHHPKV